MTRGGCNDSAANGVVELEGKRKDDFSWHPCQVSLCSGGPGLIVLYGDGDSEETMVDKEEVLASLRVRSIPLQGNSCTLIQLGDHILATENPRFKGLFFDAQVEEVHRVRHSKKIHCRCTFTIKWLHRVHEGGSLTVPSSSIMKLAVESIDLHPTISAFLSKLESSKGLSASPLPNIADSMDFDIDIHALLEEQIEKISNSADVSMKRKRNDILLGIEVNFEDQIHCRAIDTSKLSDLHVQGVLNNFKRTTRSESKQPVETKIINPLLAIPSGQDELPDIRSPTNPLAARAALASLRSNFPWAAEFSVEDNVEKADNTGNRSSMDGVSMKIEAMATLTRANPKYEGIVKTLSPTTTAPESILSSRAHSKEKENESKDGVNKTTQPPARRITRSAVHKNAEMISPKETELRSSSKTRTRSFTHSTTNKAEKIPATEAIEKNISTKCSKSKSSANIDAETNRSKAGDGENVMEKDGQIINNVSTRKTVKEDTVKPSYPKRITRAVAQENTGKNHVPRNVRLTRSRSTEPNDDVKLKTTPKSEENAASHSRCTKRKPFISKTELKSSPQLRSLPRTRSQNKA